MRHLLVAALLSIPFLSAAQTNGFRIGFRFNTGIGISNKPNIMFGVPLALSAELDAIFSDRWRVAAEVGTVNFRDSKHPYDHIGLAIFPTYPRFAHQYAGLLVGHSLLKANRPHKLFLSSGADYLLIIDPNIKTSFSLIGNKHYDYLYTRHLNIPVQLDYSILPFKNRDSKLVFIGRWNFNGYHSFPTVSVAIDIPIYPFPRIWGDGASR